MHLDVSDAMSRDINQKRVIDALNVFERIEEKIFKTFREEIELHVNETAC